ncbi:carbonate dehydratase [Herbaspirillum sp. RV1423]|uniref:carbonate dehydratase n=1 Tax=Herbaspirillum sp. RV1423 TaxID=1443993 RepID=UPI000553138D|nr:carbonate dehydratase [Herbaspirillum sp. RV1423]
MTTPSQQDQVQQQLLQGNRRWASEITSRDPDFFLKLGSQRSPEYLWIGCSDNRVPANELLGLLPGELFVHRNIANVVVHTDLNCLSVLQFAVDVLKVKHIIICGHYGCAGVQAAMTKRRVGLADNWLQHVQDVHEKHIGCFHGHMSEGDQHDRLCELNVLEQVANICRTTIVTDAWERGQALSVHALVYGVHDGLLEALAPTVSSAEGCVKHLSASLERYAGTR